MPAPDRVRQFRGRLIEAIAVGAYTQLRMTAAGVADLAQAGQFAALAVGGVRSAMMLRRCFSIYRVSKAAVGGDDVLELVIAAKGPGTEWLIERRPGDRIDIVAPLGKPFPLPDSATPTAVVGGGYGSAPLLWLARELRIRGCSVDLVIGAGSADRLFGVDEAAHVSDQVWITTDDGSAGVTGRVSDVLPDALRRTGATVVYACGPMGMLQSVTEVATTAGAVAHVAVEEAMACGVGVCMTCVLPVRNAAGVTSMVRSCVDGPIFRGDQIRWDAFVDGRCVVLHDAVGAPSRVRNA